MSHNNHKNNKSVMNTRSMGREGLKIIRNIAFSNFNFYTEGQIFRNTAFVNATIEEINKILLETNIHITAIKCAYPATGDPNILGLLKKNQRKFDAYSLAKQCLGSVAYTGDTGYIWALLTRLPDYRYDI